MSSPYRYSQVGNVSHDYVWEIYGAESDCIDKYGDWTCDDDEVYDDDDELWKVDTDPEWEVRVMQNMEPRPHEPEWVSSFVFKDKSSEARHQKTPEGLYDTAAFDHGDANPPDSNSVAAEEGTTEGKVSNDENDPAASTSHVQPRSEIINLEEEENAEVSLSSNIDGPSSTQSNIQQIAQAATPPPANSFSFEQSPIANDISIPSTMVAVGISQPAPSQNQQLATASQLAISQSQASGITEEEEHLCVVCEDEKKQVMLLPCKHMSLCKTCAHKCLFKTIKECPMCRATIDESMEVFW